MNTVALSFIDYYKQAGNFFSDLTDVHVSIYHDFVSQEFKPEMITELFDGFEFLNYAQPPAYFDNRKLPDSNIKICFPAWEPKRYCIGLGDYISKKVKEHVFITPITIDEFIVNTKRAGIELHWKQEIIDKLKYI